MLVKFPAFFLFAIVVLAAGGCSSGSGAGKTVSGWFGSSDSSSAKPDGVTRYAGQAGLTVLSKPSGTSKAVGALSLHEKVTQTGQQGGYAQIRARGGKLEGWVPAAKLVRKVSQPTSDDAADATGSVPQSGSSSDATTGAEGASDETGSTGESSAEPASGAETVTNKPAPAPEPVGPEKPRGVGASVFDPY